MTANLMRCLLAASALCAAGAFPALAQQAPAPIRGTIGAVAPTGPVASLFVLNAHGATLADGKLTMTGVSPSSIAFADRPERLAGHIETAQFVDDWRKGEDDANIDPPNATISVLDGANVSDAVVTISKPVLDGDTLTFDAVVLEGGLTGAKGAAALFIDRGGFGGFHGGGFGGGGFGGGGFRGGDFRGGGFGGADHFDHYAHVQDPHAAWYRSSGSNDRAVNYDPHNSYNYGGGWDGWGAGAAGLAAGAAIGATAANRGYWDNGYDYGPYGYGYPPYCGYAPYPPCN